MGNFEQRVIWITGAAGALGARIAERLAEQGAQVVLSGRHRETLPADAAGREIVPLDVTDGVAVETAVEGIIARHGRIDGLVSCTTAPIFGDFLDLNDDDWTRVLDTKLLGAVRLVRAVLPDMLARGDGRIVLLSGRGGRIASPRHLPGGCANAAIDLLVKGLSSAYGSRGVRVNALSPGPVNSPRLRAMQASGAGGIANALGRPAEPDDIADAALFLLSDNAAHITGTSLQVDGG